MKSITQKAQELGCDKETVRMNCIKGCIPCKKVGNTYVVFEPGEVVSALEYPNKTYQVKSNIEINKE